MGAKAYLQQLLNDGFFHADPHPGNIAVSAEGGLIFYDFGMMGIIEANVREGLMETLYGVASKDGQRIIDSLINLGALVPTGDMGPVRRSIQFMLDNFMDKPFEAQSVTKITDDLYEIAYDQPFRFPATFTFVMRAFSTIEGVGRGLDPKFNFMEVAQPFAMELMKSGNPQDTNSIFNELGRQAAQVSSTALGLPRRIEETIDKLEQGDIRVRVRASETDRLLRRLSIVQMATNYSLLCGTFVLSATILFVSNRIWLAVLAGFLAVGMGFVLWRQLRRIGRLDRMDRMS
jgi:predicted unusual protein kinase regulating ubiquinone biosynthesis (AarF/ABC1/UbiB family)